MENLVLAYILAGLVGALSIIAHERVIHKKIDLKGEIILLNLMILAWPLFLTIMACGDFRE